MNRSRYSFMFLLLVTILVGCQYEPDGSNGREIDEIQNTEQVGTDFREEPIPDTIPQGSGQSQTFSFSILDSVEYDIQENLKLVNNGPASPLKQNLWVVLISDDHPYQEVVERKISPEDYDIVVDEHGNQIAEFDFSDMPPDTEINVEIEYTVKVNKLRYDLSSCEGELPDIYTEAELHIESENPQIISLSEELAQDQLTVCDQVRAIYEYVGNELVYTYNGGNWGAQAALGKMGADCTEYASLMIALSRAAGIPARYIEGLNFTPEGEEGLARQEHAWLEVYLPGAGWTPMDPTQGRSSITREAYFAQLPPDHIIVSRGRNPSTLRGSSYWTYLYWPGDSTEINIEQFEWVITPKSD
jgi:transglutaminase-like putative cysteine protease